MRMKIETFLTNLLLAGVLLPSAPVYADEATAAAQLIADYEALGYAAPAGGLARVENNVVLDGDYVAGTITAAAKVVPPAEPVAIPDTDYGTLEFPAAEGGV